jgi:hypothetical protein
MLLLWARFPARMRELAERIVRSMEDGDRALSARRWSSFVCVGLAGRLGTVMPVPAFQSRLIWPGSLDEFARSVLGR